MTTSSRMTNMTRRDLREIGLSAMHLGLSTEQAHKALIIGVKAMSRGIDAYDIDRLATQRIEWLTRAEVRRRRST